jgi:hypothetical protein
MEEQKLEIGLGCMGMSFGYVPAGDRHDSEGRGR